MTATFPLWFISHAYFYTKYINKSRSFEQEFRVSWNAITKMPISEVYKVIAEYPERRQILEKYKDILSV
jgi:hypothetical protein